MIEHVAILAGGSGTRLWPASRARRPKQLLDLGGGESLFAATLRRALALQAPGWILVVTHREQVAAMEAACRQAASPGVPGRGILVVPEPQGRNTAPAIALACLLLEGSGAAGDRLLALPADHRIEPAAAFCRDTERAAALAAGGHLVTYGIPPARAETGYGYIEAGESLEEGLRVVRFTEKPDRRTAEEFLRGGRHYWNSGMFAFRVDVFLRELGEHAPQVAAALATLRRKARLPEAAKQGEAPVAVLAAPPGLERAYAQVPGISVDYAVMEHSRRAAVVPATFSWSDVGSWDEVAALYAEGSGRVIAVQAQGNFVHTDVPVALAGVEDLLVVVRDGAVLVCRRGESQLVRQVVERIRSEGPQELL